ncbi:MAG: hypothetical protein ACTSR8_04205 [Promethearchaeota archaeon]
MKIKNIFIFALLVLNFFAVCLSVEVQAQTKYSLDINEDDEFIWEITELNLHQFKKVFGFEPVFEKGDQTKKKIVDLLDTTYGWSIVLEEWDYNADFQRNGSIRSDIIYKNPANYEDNIFIPSPALDYLDQAKDDLPSEYIVSGLKVTKRESGFDMIKEYETNGVLLYEEYIDDDGIVLIRVERPPTIPFGNGFIGFTGFTIIGLIAIMIKKKVYSIK